MCLLLGRFFWADPGSWQPAVSCPDQFGRLRLRIWRATSYENRSHCFNLKKNPKIWHF